jgi:hypothetical protein
VTINELILVHEPGLGDHFICNGLVNYISSQVDRVLLPTYDISVHNNKATVQALYANNPKVAIVPVPIFVNHWDSGFSWQDYFSSWNTPVLQIYKPQINNPLWYPYFYTQIGMAWEDHKRLAHIPPPTPRACELLEWAVTTHGRHYRVVHNNSTSGTFEFQQVGDTSLPTISVVPGLSDSLLDWQLVLANAQEIHACQSSVFWLCTILDGLPTALFYHDSRPTQHPIFPQHFPAWQFVTGYF